MNYEQMTLFSLVELLYSYPYEEILNAAEISDFIKPVYNRDEVISLLILLENKCPHVLVRYLDLCDDCKNVAWDI
jgi:hypothetical protein